MIVTVIMIVTVSVSHNVATMKTRCLIVVVGIKTIRYYDASTKSYKGYLHLISFYLADERRVFFFFERTKRVHSELVGSVVFLVGTSQQFSAL